MTGKSNTLQLFSSLALEQVALQFCLPWATLSSLFNKQLVDSLLIPCPLGN